MNFDDAEAEIREFFRAAWVAAGFNVAYIAWPDVEFTVPAGQTWVRFNCQENEGSQASIGDPGNNRFRHFGLVILQIFQPQGQWSVDARAKAAAALGAFMGAETSNGVHFYNSYPRQVGDDENGYYQINVYASFRYDELT